MNKYVLYPLLFLLAAAMLGAGDGRPARAKFRVALIDYRAELGNPRLDRYAVRFNMAQCYFVLDSLREATTYYLTAVSKLDAEHQAIAYNNLGIMEAVQNNRKVGLDYLRLAVKANPDADEPKYNYELLKKLMQQEPPPPPPPDYNPPPVGNASNRPVSLEHKGRDWEYVPLSKAESHQMLEKLRLREAQYLQQLRKTTTMDKKFSSEPQW